MDFSVQHCIEKVHKKFRSCLSSNITYRNISKVVKDIILYTSERRKKYNFKDRYHMYNMLEWCHCCQLNLNGEH